jgi:hypothetical protein
MHVEQAELVFEARGIDRGRYEFVTADLYELDWSTLGRFDLVLCLGLLYHVNRPMELLERIAAVNDDLLVIDTNLSKLPGAFLELHHESVDDPRNTVGYDLTFQPTKSAVVEMVRQFGYDVATLRPGFTDWTGAEDYRSAARRAFVCSRRTPLGGFPQPVEPEAARSTYHKALRFLLKRVLP